MPYSPRTVTHRPNEIRDAGFRSRRLAAVEAAGDSLLAVHQPPGSHAPGSGAPIQIADAAPEYPACVLMADDHPPRWQESRAARRAAGVTRRRRGVVRRGGARHRRTRADRRRRRRPHAGRSRWSVGEPGAQTPTQAASGRALLPVSPRPARRPRRSSPRLTRSSAHPPRARSCARRSAARSMADRYCRRSRPRWAAMMRELFDAEEQVVLAMSSSGYPAAASRHAGRVVERAEPALMGDAPQSLGRDEDQDDHVSVSMCPEAAGSRSSCRPLGRRYTELCRGAVIPERVSLVSTAHVARARGPFGRERPSAERHISGAQCGERRAHRAEQDARGVGPRHARGFMEPETERPGLRRAPRLSVYGAC